MRIDKFLCDTLNISRKESKSFFKSNEIKVNDTIINDSGFIIDESNDKISVNNKPVTYEKFVYYMLNKPSGYVTAKNDNLFPTVMDLFKGLEKDLNPVGRLDKDTVGLLIITNDGAFNHHLTSPKHHVRKTYLVGIKNQLSKEDITRLETGIDLHDDGLTGPAKVTVLDKDFILLTIGEGKFHQVKRMLLAVNNEVLSLKRLSIGNLKLDENLKEGEFRKLTKEEIVLLSEKEGNI